MEKTTTFAERLRFSLSMYGIPMEAPQIHAFIAAQSKTLKIENPAKSRQTIHNWIKKGKTPDPDGYAKLSLILNVSTYWLITGEIRPTPSFMVVEANKTRIKRAMTA